MTSAEKSKEQQEQNIESTPEPQVKTNRLAVVSLVMAFIVPLIGLIMSIVALNQIKKTKEKGKGIAIAGIVVSIIVMIFQFVLVLAISLKGPVIVEYSDEEKGNQSTTSQSQQQDTKEPEYILNLPDLLGKNIDEIRATLGQPKDGELTDPTPIQAEGSSQWDNTFVIKDKELLVTYDINTKKVIDFFVPTPDVANKAELLVLFNLRDGDPSYTIKEVKAIKDPGKITGFTVTPTK